MNHQSLSRILGKELGQIMYISPLLLTTFGLLVTGNPIAQSDPIAPDNQVNLYVLRSAFQTSTYLQVSITDL